jgi:hypothetical protein
VSDIVPPDIQAYHELESVVRMLGNELALFRRRALQAEARLKEIDASTRTGELFAEQRMLAAERENVELRTRLASATERTRQLLEQVRFLRQQHERAGGGGR